MAYEPSFERTDAIDGLCMEIAELVGMLSPQAPLSTSPTLRRELRIQTIYSSLVIEGNKLDERAVSAITTASGFSEIGATSSKSKTCAPPTTLFLNSILIRWRICCAFTAS